MHSAMDFLLRHGYIVLFVAVALEQIGLPIPSGPVLLAAGALAGSHRLNLGPALALAVAASLICDSLWFALGRLRGVQCSSSSAASPLNRIPASPRPTQCTCGTVPSRC